MMAWRLEQQTRCKLKRRIIMREPQSPPRPMSAAEHLGLEANSDVKHEFWWGELVARAGATSDPVTIAAN